MLGVLNRKEGALLLCVCVCVCAITITSTEAEKLKILVPLKLGFLEFVSWDGTPNSPNLSFSGFAVDVFERCVRKLPYKLDYEFVGFGDGVSDPLYNAMVEKLANKEADGIVADITITEDRMQLVDFTQPYLQSSLKMVVAYDYKGLGGFWNFLQPFHPELWGSIGAVFVLTGVVIFIVEYDNKLFHGENLDWRTRMANIFWYTSMTLFFCQRTDHEISTRLGRVLTVFWLMVVLIFTSSYTASLTSILSAKQQSPTIESFEDLWRSNLQVGYQDGSFMENYLQDSLKFRRSRLVKLVTREDYVNDLELGPKNGGVAGILDESPYLETFLNSECAYTTPGPDIAYFGGLGFAFQKNSNLTDAISLAIVSLSRNRELQTVKESWLGSRQCTQIRAGTYIPLENFGGLFTIIAGVYGACVILRILGWVLHAYRRKKHTSKSSRQVSHDGQEDQNQQVEIQLEPNVKAEQIV